MNHICIQIEINEHNAKLIEQINKLVASSLNSTSSPKAESAPKAESTPKAESNTKAESGVTFAEVKEVIKAAKADHGEEFCKGVLTAAGAKGSTLGRLAGSLEKDAYAETVAQLQAGPKQEEVEELEEDDDFGDDLDDGDDSEIDAEAVKLAVRSYAKEAGRDKAKHLMNSNGATSLASISDCTPAQLRAMFKAATA